MKWLVRNDRTIVFGVVVAISFVLGVPLIQDILCALGKYYTCKPIPQEYERTLSTALSLVAVPSGLCLGYYYYMDKQKRDKRERLEDQKLALLRETEASLGIVQNEIYEIYLAKEGDHKQYEVLQQRVKSSAEGLYTLLSNFELLYPEHREQFSPLYPLYSFIDQIDENFASEGSLKKYNQMHAQVRESIITLRIMNGAA